MAQNPTQKGLATTMYILAWVLAIGLLALAFNEWYENAYNPNQQPLASNNLGQKQITLKPNKQHHYLVSGSINQQEVVFLLDTGATHVAVPAHIADKLRLAKGSPYYVSTANGKAKAFQTSIDILSLGDINLHNIKASINPGMKEDVVLLGMSALKQLEFSQKGELLILRQ